MRDSIHARFESFYEAHRGVVQRCVASFGVPRHMWPDIVQDVWLTACRRLEQVTAHPRPEAWLCKVARNHMLHHVRSHLRRQRKHDAAAVHPTSDSDDPFGERDAWDTLQRLLANCPVEQREVYLKIELYGMTAQEVADELEVSVNTVHSRLRLTRQRLREVSAALATLLALLRTSLARDGLGEHPPMSAALLRAQSGTVATTHRSGNGGTASKVVLAALLIVPVSESQRSDEVVLAEPTIASLVDAADLGESVHTRVIQLAPAEPAFVTVAAPIGMSAPRATSRAAPRAARRRQGAAASKTVLAPLSLPPEPRLAPLDDGERLLAAARKAYRENRFERALDYLTRHRRLYPASELRESREAYVVRTLCQLGRETEASEQLRAFARDSPDDRAFRASLGTLREECR